jgi:hypothetical protein
MTDNEIRGGLRIFVGEDAFSGFTFLAVNTGNPPHIPEQMRDQLDAFRLECPSMPSDGHRIRDLLLYCLRHDQALQLVNTSTCDVPPEALKTVTLIKRSPSWYDASKADFPHGHGGLTTICPQCVEAHLAWLSLHGRPDADNKILEERRTMGCTGGRFARVLAMAKSFFLPS